MTDQDEQNPGWWSRKLTREDPEPTPGERVRANVLRSGGTRDYADAMAGQEDLAQALDGVVKAADRAASGVGGADPLPAARARFDVELARMAARVANRNAKASERYARRTFVASVLLVVVTLALVVATVALVIVTGRLA